MVAELKADYLNEPAAAEAIRQRFAGFCCRPMPRTR
jgi:hypothetical protein